MNDSTIRLSQRASIQAHLQIARKAIASSENDLRRAAEHIAKAHDQGATQQEIADAVGKSRPWVSQMLSWRRDGYQDPTPFGLQSKASRERAKRQPTDGRPKTKRSDAGREQAEAAAARARAGTAKAEAAKAKADAAKATAEQRRARAEAFRAQADAARAEAEARTARARSNNPNKQKIHSGPRGLLVKALGMLGSDQAGERDNATRVVERERKKLGMTWDQLIIPADEAEARRRGGAADLHTSN